MIELDDLDETIIAQLRADGRISVAELSRVLSTSEATVRQRIKRLNDTHGIAIGLIANAVSLGFSVFVFMKLRVLPAHISSAMQKLSENSNISLVYRTSGPFNVVVGGSFENHDGLTDFLSNHIHTIAGIQDVDVNLVRAAVKQEYSLVPIVKDVGEDVPHPRV